jgi:hypothetical protein
MLSTKLCHLDACVTVLLNFLQLQDTSNNFKYSFLKLWWKKKTTRKECLVQVLKNSVTRKNQDVNYTFLGLYVEITLSLDRLLVNSHLQQLRSLVLKFQVQTLLATTFLWVVFL